MNPDVLQQQFYKLSYYTLAHSDPGFIHQHIVDAFTAQTADENTKPIAITFALKSSKCVSEFEICVNRVSTATR